MAYNWNHVSIISRIFYLMFSDYGCQLGQKNTASGPTEKGEMLRMEAEEGLLLLA